MSQNNFRHRLFSGIGGDPSLPGRMSVLENNEYEVIYFTEINGTTGTITPPTGATILLDQFQAGADAFVSTITNNEPTGIMPKTAGGVNVDVTSFDALGNFTLSGTPSSYPVALIYVFKISGLNWSNVDLNNTINYYPTNVLRTTDIDTDGALTTNSDTKVASQKATKTYADAKVSNAINNGTTTAAPSENAVYDALAIHEGEWKTIAQGRAFHSAGTVTSAGIYWHNSLGHASTLQGSTGANTAPCFVYIKSSDFVSSIGLTPKLRIKIHLFSVNNVAPARTFTVGLYPCSGPSTGSTGGAGVRIYDAGTVVTGSDGYSVASPAADTFTTDQYSSVFSLPADGLYAIACDISGAMAASSGVHILAELQYHFE